MLHINRAWEPHINQESHTECYMISMHGSHTLIKIPSQWMLHVNHAGEPHVNLDLFISHTVSQIIKIPLENPCTWVTILSTIKSVTNTFRSWGEKTKKKRNSNLWKLCLPQQLLWASCCWVGQGISCSFCAIAIQQQAVMSREIVYGKTCMVKRVR